LVLQGLPTTMTLQSCLALSFRARPCSMRNTLCTSRQQGEKITTARYLICIAWRHKVQGVNAIVNRTPTLPPSKGASNVHLQLEDFSVLVE
jgi:hypothetical protein